MIKKHARSILVFLSLAAAFLAGSWYNQRAVTNANSGGSAKVLYYACPMHPEYTSARPGDAPCCGMRLQPVRAQGGGSAVQDSHPPGAVQVSPDQQQRTGVRVAAVEKASASHTLRLFGRVAAEETRTYKLLAGADGFIRRDAEVTTGSYVRKDQWLATFSAPESRAPIQAFLTTMDALARHHKSRTETPAQGRSARESFQVATDKLLNLGISPLQIEEIRATGEVPVELRILAPADGFVLARNVSLGQKFGRGDEWFRIADLSRVWILADVFRSDARHLRPGVRAQVTLPGEQKSVSATVSQILPQFDPASRTLKVRFEMDNPGYAFRPDMLVDVELPIGLPAAIAVPADAVVDSGLRKTVFVERGDGVFEPRQVETGWRVGDRVEIVRGLEIGERIAVSGTFLLDSESRMRLAAAAASRKEIDPVCQMEVAPAEAAATSRHQGKTFHFCSKSCKERFDKEPQKYVAAGV